MSVASRLGLTLLLLATVVTFPVDHVSAQSSRPVSPKDVQADATFEHIGFVWWIEGDSDRDSTLTLEFRKAGTAPCSPTRNDV